jgi:hypothetical protein
VKKLGTGDAHFGSVSVFQGLCCVEAINLESYPWGGGGGGAGGISDCVPCIETSAVLRTLSAQGFR